MNGWNPRQWIRWGAAALAVGILAWGPADILPIPDIAPASSVPMFGSAPQTAPATTGQLDGVAASAGGGRVAGVPSASSDARLDQQTASQGGATGGGLTPVASPVPAPSDDVSDSPDGPAGPQDVSGISPLIRILDQGQTSGTPLVLGILTSLAASQLPANTGQETIDDLVAQLAVLIASPNAQVNDITESNSEALAQLHDALRPLAVANPAITAGLLSVADALEAIGNAFGSLIPVVGRDLADYAELIRFFVEEG